MAKVSVLQDSIMSANVTRKAGDSWMTHDHLQKAYQMNCTLRLKVHQPLDIQSIWIKLKISLPHHHIPSAESYPRERERTLDIGVSPVVGRHHDGEELEVDEGDVGGRQPRGDLFRVRRAD